jgi:hypothetical protein
MGERFGFGFPSSVTAACCDTLLPLVMTHFFDNELLFGQLIEANCPPPYINKEKF